MAFEWEIYPGHTTLQLPDEVPLVMREMKCEPGMFKDRIIFMSMYNDIDWDKKHNETVCVANSHMVSDFAQECPNRYWSFLGPCSEDKWYGTHNYKPDGQRNQTADRMIAFFFNNSGHLVFRASSALNRRTSKSKEEV